jgi:hypothetical protein
LTNITETKSRKPPTLPLLLAISSWSQVVGR